jgi:hypothetical protein
VLKAFLKNIEGIVRDAAERRRISFNERLESFNDNFAKEIDWTPAVKGGVGFRTRTMVASGHHSLKFRPSLTPLALCFGALAIGLWIIFAFSNPGVPLKAYFLDFFNVVHAWYFRLFHQIRIERILTALFGLIFVMIGSVGLYKLFRPVKFESDQRTFSRGYSFFRPTVVPFNDIKAIQILSEYCKGDKNRSYRSYEVNLVLHNKSRVTVVDHSDLSEIRRNGDALSKMLSAPLWDISKT